MSTAVKGYTIRVYVDDEQLKLLKEFSDSTGLSQTNLASLLLGSSLRSIKDNNGRFQMPLRFKICDGLDEPSTSPPRGQIKKV
tara:strand:+ start:79 stop:327 length:249 start_codon:yes stop_codon:yes gene_type:complete